MKKTINDLTGFEDICNEQIVTLVKAGCSEGPINTDPDREKREAENYEYQKQFQPTIDRTGTTK